VTQETDVEIDEIAFCFGCQTKKRKSPNLIVYVTYKSGQASKHLLLTDTSKSGIPLGLLKSLIGAMLPLLNWLTDIYALRKKQYRYREKERERESQSHEKR